MIESEDEWMNELSRIKEREGGLIRVCSLKPWIQVLIRQMTGFC